MTKLHLAGLNRDDLELSSMLLLNVRFHEPLIMTELEHISLGTVLNLLMPNARCAVAAGLNQGRAVLTAWSTRSDGLCDKIYPLYSQYGSATYPFFAIDTKGGWQANPW